MHGGQPGPSPPKPPAQPTCLSSMPSRSMRRSRVSEEMGIWQSASARESSSTCRNPSLSWSSWAAGAKMKAREQGQRCAQRYAQAAVGSCAQASIESALYNASPYLSRSSWAAGGAGASAPSGESRAVGYIANVTKLLWKPFRRRRTLLEYEASEGPAPLTKDQRWSRKTPLTKDGMGGPTDRRWSGRAK